MSESEHSFERRVPLWQPMVFAALAGGMGWGVRGQYGHETAAMMAGLLVCLTLTCLLAPRTHPLALARAAALGTLGMGIGGSMTYAQTLGLWHDPELVGNWEALRWGVLGTSLKGAIWIGFGGLFFGMGLGGVRYRPGEMFMLLLAMLGLFFTGVSLVNSPFDISERELPYIYFSASWHFQPDTPGLKPRPEIWAGLLAALIAGILYTGWRRKDGLAWRLGLWAMLGGAIGFPAGQAIQSYNAWNREAVAEGVLHPIVQHINWWNMMETTFGAVMAAFIGLGLWLHRKRIAPAEPNLDGRLSTAGEVALLLIHVPMLVSVEFLSLRSVDSLYDLGLIMVIIPLCGVVGGRYWPYLQLLPLTLIPIAGKTLRNLGYEEGAVNVQVGWVVYVILPVALFVWLAWVAIKRSQTGRPSRALFGWMLLVNAWMYYLLNFAFFRFPWPWDTWTGRTPNAIIYTICLAGLTWVAFRAMTEREAEE